MTKLENIAEPNEIIVFRLFIGTISVIGNGIILYIALKFKKFRSTYCNCLIALLAFAEIILGMSKGL